jgi:nitrogen regulatory protein P-II 1
MKEIKATIQSHMADKVIHALHELPHFPGLTIFEMSGQGRGRGEGGAYLPTEETIFYERRKRIEIICGDEVAGSIAETIRNAARTGVRGDGLIIITDINTVIRIRSGERQDRAV